MTALEILKKARAKITLPENWTQKEYARDSEGSGVSIKDGVCFCSIGAIQSVAIALDISPIGIHLSIPVVQNWVSAVDTLNVILEGGSIIEFNDTHTHAEVLAMFDAGIASLEPVSKY